MGGIISASPMIGNRYRDVIMLVYTAHAFDDCGELFFKHTIVLL